MLKIIIFLYLLCIGRTAYRWTDPRRWIKSSNIVFSLWGSLFGKFGFICLNGTQKTDLFFLLFSGEAALAGGQTTFPRPPPVERASSEVNVVFGVDLLPAGRSPEVRLPRTQKISKNAEKWLSAFLLIRLSGFAGRGDRHLLKRQYAFWYRQSVVGR